MKRNMFVLSCLVAALFMGTALFAGAGEWPPKRLTLVWHSKAGSAGDLMMRSIGKFLETKFKVTAVIENRTGASGANAWGSVARSKPDGGILLGVSSTFMASPLQNKMDVDYTKLDPVAMLFLDAICIYVAGDSPYNTLKDLFDDAKKKPGQLSLTGGTAGNTEFVSARRLLAEAGVDMSVVPFDGGSEGAVSVMGGHVTAGVGEYSEVAAGAEAKKLKVLAMFNAVPGVNIPSVADAGYKTTVEKFRGIVVPKNTPQPIKDAIYNALKEMMDDPSFKTYYTQNTLVPSFKNGEEFLKVMERQTADLKESLKGLK